MIHGRSSRSLRALAAAALVLVLTASAPATARAHDVDVTGVARIFLDQIGERSYVLSVVDLQAPPLTAAEGVLPERCTPLPAGSRSPRGPAPTLSFECATPLTFEDRIVLPWSLSGAVAIARWQEGGEASAYFRGDGREIRLELRHLSAGAGSSLKLSAAYLSLGIEHILLGIDHLFFVLGLLLLVRGPWPLVKTITAFTLAHSVTLGAAVLGFVSVPGAPVEAAIALSIVLLAREVVLGARGRDGLVQRYPWAVAFGFGLLHGLGFAGALSEVGVPANDVPLALLTFNIGVEVGQLIFVAAMVTAYGVARRLAASLPRRMEPALGYALGAMAMVWLIDRLPDVFLP
jgi:hypothetical protein